MSSSFFIFVNLQVSVQYIIPIYKGFSLIWNYKTLSGYLQIKMYPPVIFDVVTPCHKDFKGNPRKTNLGYFQDLQAHLEKGSYSLGRGQW
jgi:hypothetical protein